MSKTIFRISKNRDNPYVMLDKRLLSDRRLSWKAKGILTYLLSKPDGWIVQIHDIVQQSEEGEHAVRAGVIELIQAGYIKRDHARKLGGQFAGYIYQVYEQPKNVPPSEPEAPPDRGFPYLDKPDMGFPDMENRDVNNNESIKEVVNGKNSKISQLFCEVTGMVSIPPSGMQYIETMQDMIDGLGYEEAKRRMKESYDVWIERDGKNGRSYSKTNLKWIEYALADQPPIKGNPIPATVITSPGYARPQYGTPVDQIPVFRAGDQNE